MTSDLEISIVGDMSVKCVLLYLHISSCKKPLLLIAFAENDRHLTRTCEGAAARTGRFRLQTIGTRTNGHLVRKRFVVSINHTTRQHDRLR